MEKWPIGRLTDWRYSTRSFDSKRKEPSPKREDAKNQLETMVTDF